MIILIVTVYQLKKQENKSMTIKNILIINITIKKH